MTFGANAAKWMGKWLLQIPAYWVTSYATGMLVAGCYNLLMRIGANLPPRLLLQHFLWRALLDGFLAGLVGLVIFRAMMLLPAKSARVHGPAWKRPQAWTWVIPTFWLAYGMLAWYGNHARFSVLGSVGPTRPDLIAAFFGDGCSIAGSSVGISTIIYCMPQITFAHPWLGTLGYSAAAFIPSDWFAKLRGSRSPEVNAAAIEHSEQTAEQNRA
jgi:hypothetical protein